MIQFDKELTTTWIKELRAETYPQVKEMLSDGEGYCCLGVLAKIAGAEQFGETMILDGQELLDGAVTHSGLLEKTGLDDKTESYLIACNDTYGYTFPQIADRIEQILERQNLL